MDNKKKKFKITLICMICVAACMFIAGMVQTFVLKSRQDVLSKTKIETQAVKDEYDEKQTKYNYMSNEDGSDYSDEYYEDYYKQQGYGEDGDKKIEIND